MKISRSKLEEVLDMILGNPEIIMDEDGFSISSGRKDGHCIVIALNEGGVPWQKQPVWVVTDYSDYGHCEKTDFECSKDAFNLFNNLCWCDV